MKKNIKYFWILLIIVGLLIAGILLFKKILLNYGENFIRDNSADWPIAYTDIQQDTCTPAICLTIQNAQVVILDRIIHLGNIQIKLKKLYPFTIQILNTVSKTGDYAIGIADIAPNETTIHQLDFHLSPLSGSLNGKITEQDVQVQGNIQKLRSFLQQNWNTLNIRLPIELTYLLSNANIPVSIIRQNDWIYLNNIPIFQIQ